MGLNGINNNQQTQSAYQTKIDSVTQTKSAEATDTKTASNAAVVYEKSSANSTKTTYADSKSIVAQMKADAEARTASMKSLVEKLLTKQSGTFQLANANNGDNIWNQIRLGNFTADAQTIAQAKEDISEDGYWGVKQTSERMIDFAKALSGGDAGKIDELTAAIKKGFEKAEKMWGGELPEISQKTYDAVMKGMEDWKAEAAAGTQA